VFFFIVLAGYLAGIINKVLCGIDVVIAFYVINLLLVAADISLSYRNKIRASRSGGDECEPQRLG
jgi:hypothetical protein